MSKKLQIYYAHPMAWYGSKEEAADLALLLEHGDVENPATSVWEKRVARAKEIEYPVMDLFAKHIRETADVVAFRRFKDFKIGAGVSREILEARIWGKVVWEIKTNSLNGQVWLDRYPDIDFLYDDTLTVAATRDHKDTL